MSKKRRAKIPPFRVLNSENILRKFVSKIMRSCDKNFAQLQEVFIIDNIEAKMKGKMVPIWEKYMLTVDEAVQYFGIGEKKIRMLISENTDTDYCFTVQVGNKSLINRHKFEEFLNQTTSL